MWDLVPWPGIEPRLPTLGAQSLSHWTTSGQSGGEILDGKKGSHIQMPLDENQTLPVHLGVHVMMSTLCSFFLIFRPLPSSGLSLIRNMNFNCSKDRPTHRSPATGFVALRNKQVSSAKFSQYPTREPCLHGFDVTTSSYHEESEWSIAREVPGNLSGGPRGLVSRGSLISMSVYVCMKMSYCQAQFIMQVASLVFEPILSTIIFKKLNEL